MRKLSLWLHVVLAGAMASSSLLARGADEVHVQGACLDAENVVKDSAFNTYAPAAYAFKQLGLTVQLQGNEYDSPSLEVLAATTVRLVEPPLHGTFVLLEPARYHFWSYQAEDGFVGTDAALFLVTVNTREVFVGVNVLVQEVIQEPKCDESGNCEALEPPCWSHFPNDPRH